MLQIKMTQYCRIFVYMRVETDPVQCVRAMQAPVHHVSPAIFIADEQWLQVALLALQVDKIQEALSLGTKEAMSHISLNLIIDLEAVQNLK